MPKILSYILFSTIIKEKGCKTIGGYNPNAPNATIGARCIFPFKFEGKMNYGCVCSGQTFCEYLWCSTKVDSTGNHIEGHEGQNWGYCPKNYPENRNCQGYKGKVCLKLEAGILINRNITLI